MIIRIVAGAMLFAAPAFAQTSTMPAPTAPNRVAPQVTNPGGPGVANSGPGATGTVQTEGTGAGTISNNPAGDGNSQMPNRPSSTPSGSGSGG